MGLKLSFYQGMLRPVGGACGSCCLPAGQGPPVTVDSTIGTGPHDFAVHTSLPGTHLSVHAAALPLVRREHVRVWLLQQHVASPFVHLQPPADDLHARVQADTEGPLLGAGSSGGLQHLISAACTHTHVAGGVHCDMPQLARPTS